MNARSWNSQRCILIVVQLICVVSLVNCSPPNLIDSSRVPSPSAADDNSPVVATIQSIRKDAEVAIQQSGVNELGVNATQESFVASARANDDFDDANEQKSITIRLEDVHELLKELMQNDADAKANTENSLEKQSGEERAYITDLLFDPKFVRRLKKFTKKYIFDAGSASSSLSNVIPSAGRVFFFKGEFREDPRGSKHFGEVSA